MNERLSTRSLADILAIQTGLDKERAEKFIDVLSSHITQGIENNKAIKVMGLGIFKIVLVRERESVHIQTGERFVIPAHHKLSFIPDKNLKEQINRPFAFFEPIEATEDILSLRKQTIEDETEDDDVPESDYEKTEPEVPVVILDDDITQDLSEEVNIYPGMKPEDEPVSEIMEVYSFRENEDEGITSAQEVLSGESGAGQYTFGDWADDTDVVEDVGLLREDDEDDAVRDKDENTDWYKDNQVESRRKEKKTMPLWLWFILLPLLVVIGVGVGTYAFLHYNSEKPDENTSSLSGNNRVDTKHRDGSVTPLPIGESRVSAMDEPAAGGMTDGDAQLIWEGIENTDSVFRENAPNGKIAVGSKDTESVKKERKPVIDWLAPSSESAKPEPKRADKPNVAIEEKNKSLSANSRSRSGEQTRTNTTASTANKSENTSSAKVIPARVRMAAGSSLTQIAMEHYGDKVFWVYIYDYNKSRIKDFNNIPVGTEIRLPQPNTYGINAKNKTSLQKARRKQSELLKWDNWDDYQ